MFGPGRHSESEALVGFIEAQLASLRASAHGLTDEQARETPCRSALSIGGLIKHATYVLRGSESATLPSDEAGYLEFVASFALTPDESLAAALDAFDVACRICLAETRSVDPGAEWVAPPAPWDGQLEPVPSVQRFILMHYIEEFARHAGHADVIREQLDGADAASLLMALEGRAGNDFVQPWTPA